MWMAFAFFALKKGGISAAHFIVGIF